MKWINIKDKKPKKTDVLVTDGLAQMVAEYLGKGKFDFFGLDFWQSEHVTHWMPLPPNPNKYD